MAILVAALGGGSTTLSQTREPTRAVGRIVWAETYEERGDDPGETWGQGTDGVLTVRMRRVGSVWEDAGSTFRATYESWRAPVAFGGCMTITDEVFWARPGSRFGLRDPATGSLMNSIDLELHDDTGVADLIAVMGGGPYVIYRKHTGPDCPHGYPDVPPGITCGEFGCVLPYDSLASPGALPHCPLSTVGLQGTPDATGTRLTFDCHSTRSGITENDEATYQEAVTVTGSVRLLP
jgi:hypothetical protein